MEDIKIKELQEEIYFLQEELTGIRDMLAGVTAALSGAQRAYAAVAQRADILEKRLRAYQQSKAAIDPLVAGKV